MITRIGNQMAQSIESLKLNLVTTADGLKTPATPTSNSSSILDLSSSFGRMLKSPIPRDSTSHDIKSFSDYRILKELTSIICAGTFFYSSGYDLTNSYQRKEEAAAHENKSPIDERFWWNRNMVSGFMNFNHVRPRLLILMQGFVHVEICQLEDQYFDFVLISRRSVDRNGLRYMRRGVDDNGNVANFVETEQVAIFYGADKKSIAHVVSFVQIRGSIPLYWSQAPTRRKPVPKLEKSQLENTEAFKQHFTKVKNAYGQSVICVSLVETSGREGIISKAFRRYINELQDINMRYHEFDVHLECRGMKYENIEKLLSRVEPDIDRIGYFWKGPKGVLSKQSGIIRTNCMDCLDRTNVVQCAFGRYTLNMQLLRIGVHSYPEKGLAFYEDFEVIYNHAWANNGDAISIAYTNTSALKGDVTRTGKRNIRGVLTDGAFALMRMYQNNFRDAFRQRVIDYALGVVTFKVFETEDIEVAGQSANEEDEDDAVPKSDILQCVKDYVLSEQETILECVPIQLVHRNSFMRIVCKSRIFVLTETAIFICYYDFDLAKIVYYQKIPLKSLVHITKGPAMLAEFETECFGFSITFVNNEELETRISSTKFNSKELLSYLYPTDDEGGTDKRTIHIVIDQPSPSDKQYAPNIMDQIAGKLEKLKREVPATDQINREQSFITEGRLLMIDSQSQQGHDGLFRRFGDIVRNKLKSPSARDSHDYS